MDDVDDPAGRLAVTLRRARTHEGAGRYPQALRLYRRVLTSGASCGDAAEVASVLARAHAGYAAARLGQGRATQAVDHAHAAARHAEQARDDATLAEVARHTGSRLGGQGLAQAMVETGYESIIEDGETRFRNCPFHVLRERDREVTCGLNLALVEGMIEGSGSSASAGSFNAASMNGGARVLSTPKIGRCWRRWAISEDASGPARHPPAGGAPCRTIRPHSPGSVTGATSGACSRYSISAGGFSPPGPFR